MNRFTADQVKLGFVAVGRADGHLAHGPVATGVSAAAPHSLQEPS